MLFSIYAAVVALYGYKTSLPETYTASFKDSFMEMYRGRKIGAKKESPIIENTSQPRSHDL